MQLGRRAQQSANVATTAPPASRSTRRIAKALRPRETSTSTRPYEGLADHTLAMQKLNRVKLPSDPPCCRLPLRNSRRDRATASRGHWETKAATQRRSQGGPKPTQLRRVARIPNASWPATSRKPRPALCPRCAWRPQNAASRPRARQQTLHGCASVQGLQRDQGKPTALAAKKSYKATTQEIPMSGKTRSRKVPCGRSAAMCATPPSPMPPATGSDKCSTGAQGVALAEGTACTGNATGCCQHSGHWWDMSGACQGRFAPNANV